jgi:hypothetical protein
MTVRVATYCGDKVITADAKLPFQLKNESGTFYGENPMFAIMYYRDDVMTDSEAVELFEATVKARFG